MSLLRIAFLLLCSSNLQAQAPAQDTVPYATIDQLMTELYGVISGPRGERDWATFKALYHPTAMMGSIAIDAEGHHQFHAFSPEQYIERNGQVFKKYDFYENELNRKTQIFGNIAQVFTSYEFELTRPEGVTKKRGINCIQLVREKGRWWITNIIWQAENDQTPLPQDMLGEE